jgi:hypothetical protein
VTFVARLLLLGTVLPILGAPVAVDAAPVLVFNSSRYVDSGQTGYTPGSQESDNVQAALTALGHTVTAIAGPTQTPACEYPPGGIEGTLLATAAEYAAALANTRVFLIPEQESWCSMPNELPSETATVWRTWVENGGGLIIHSSEEAMQKVDDTFFDVFGFRVPFAAGTGVTTTRTPAAASTRFASGPPTLPGNDSTGLLSLAGLPAGSISVYDNGTHASVVIIPFGAGKIIFLGWDWTKSEPAFPGDQNGGWYPAILDGAVHEAGERRLAVTKTGAGTGTVHTAPTGVDCGATCAAYFTAGTQVTLTATPASGSEFAGWSGHADCADGVVTLSGDRACTATFVVAGSLDFADVPAGYFAAPWIATLVRAGVATGCSATPRLYCPETAVTREQMAVFLLKSRYGPSFAPAPCTSAPFADVPCGSPFAAWIQELVSRGIASGCGGGNFCPASPVTREQMAVFLLRTLGVTPAPCVSPPFGDVPCASPFAAWVAELAARGIAAGCGPGLYCPTTAVTRAQMAVFLVKAFNLQ